MWCGNRSVTVSTRVVFMYTHIIVYMASIVPRAGATSQFQQAHTLKDTHMSCYPAILFSCLSKLCGLHARPFIWMTKTNVNAFVYTHLKNIAQK